MLSREYVAQLAGLLLEPGHRLRIRDLALPVGDLLGERRVLSGQRRHLRVEVPALRHLPVDGKRDKTADSGDEHDGNPAQRDRTVKCRTLSWTDDAFLFLGAV